MVFIRAIGCSFMLREGAHTHGGRLEIYVYSHEKPIDFTI